jgi:hypothetical protein
MAGEQRRLAHASKRDSTAMKGLSLLGALFLPSTYLASLFSMTFFNFQNGKTSLQSPSIPLFTDNGNTDRADGDEGSTVSPRLWIYFVIAIPLTTCIVGSWLWFDKRREAQFAREDEDLERNIHKMEVDIMAMMRKRTMSKASTWNTISSPPRP